MLTHNYLFWFFTTLIPIIDLSHYWLAFDKKTNEELLMCMFLCSLTNYAFY